jgi:hypothetical protein
MLQSGARWRDCPPEYGPYTTIYNRFNRWAKRGRWQAIFEALANCGRPAPSRRSNRAAVLGQPEADSCSYRAPTPVCGSFDQIDLIGDSLPRPHLPHHLDVRRAESACPHMGEIELLIEAHLIAERALVEAVDAAGGIVPLHDGRTATVGRAEFDALSSGRCKRVWVTVRRNAPMPPRR